MALQKITLGALTRFDGGKVAAAFDAEMETMVADLRDRAADTGKRTVTLTVEVVPQVAAVGDCETAMVAFAVNSRIPKRTTRAYEVGVRKNNSMVVNAESPGDVHQATLDEEVDRRAAHEPPESTMSEEARRRMEGS